MSEWNRNLFPRKLMSNKNNINFAILGLSIVFSYLLPIHIHPLRTFYQDAIVILGLLLAILSLSLNGQLKLRFNGLSLIGIGLASCILCQFLLEHSQALEDLFIPCLYLLLLPFAYSVGASLSTEREQQEKLCLAFAYAYVLAGALSVAMQIVQISGLHLGSLVMFISNAGSFPRPYANVAQPNQLALMLCFALASTWFLYRKIKITKTVAIVAAVTLIVGLVFTQSRIGWIILPVFCFYIWKTQTDVNERRAPAAFFMLLLMAYFLMVFGLSHIIGHFGFSGGSVAEHVGGRSERMGLWAQAWSMAAHHLWFGVGWGGFGPAQVQIAADFPSSTYAEHAHNIVLNFAAELGWPLTVLIFTGLGCWFYRACMQPVKTSTRQFAILCLIAVFVHSLVEFPLWYGYVLFPTAIFMGMLHQMRWSGGGVMIRKALIIPVVVFGLFLTGAITWDYQRVVTGFNVLRWEQSGTKVDVRLLEQPEFTFFSQFFAYFKLMKIEPAEGMSKETIAYVEHWTPRFGFVHILNKMAEIYVLNGAPEKAERMMQTLQRLHPDLYPDYFDYWKAKGNIDARYRVVFVNMPRRDAP